MDSPQQPTDLGEGSDSETIRDVPKDEKQSGVLPNDEESASVLQRKIELAIKLLQDKLELKEEEIKVKEDLYKLLRDFECAFFEFNKGFKQCERIVDSYAQTKNHIKEQIENQKIRISTKEDVSKLMSVLEEKLDQLEVEVANAKHAADDQIALLESQVKEAQSKVLSFEIRLNSLISAILSTQKLYDDISPEVQKKNVS